ncbi:hypothetical protein IT407_00140 [Candidatus Uhrbacteria bacterium]|nr:hypothetical protein [Candidatus Uhrbacteria bacterium]
MKNGTQNVLFVAAFAALFTGCPPPNHMDPDSGPMPMEDAYVPPGEDAGVDAYVPPDEDGGTDTDSGVPGACTPDQIAAGTPGCTTCVCDMPEWMTAACGERPELCRTGEAMRNTCGMTAGTNRCGFDLPLEGGTTGNMTPYVGGFSDLCRRAIDHTTWGVVATGTLFCVESMQVNGQLTMLFTGGGACDVPMASEPWSGSFSCQRVGGVDVCTSSASNADMSSEHNGRMTFASDCLTARFEVFQGATRMSETTLSFSTFR